MLLDVAAEYAGWNADMTRTVPVNGKFTKRQRAVYDAVLRVYRGANEILRPGNNPLNLVTTFHLQAIWAIIAELRCSQQVIQIANQFFTFH